LLGQQCICAYPHKVRLIRRSKLLATHYHINAGISTKEWWSGTIYTLGSVNEVRDVHVWVQTLSQQPPIVPLTHTCTSSTWLRITSKHHRAYISQKEANKSWYFIWFFTPFHLVPSLSAAVVMDRQPASRARSGPQLPWPRLFEFMRKSTKSCTLPDSNSPNPLQLSL